MLRIFCENRKIKNFDETKTLWLLLWICKDETSPSLRQITYSFNLYISARGANVNKVNSKGYTPLHDAVKRGDLEVVTELLAYGADSALDVKAG